MQVAVLGSILAPHTVPMSIRSDPGEQSQEEALNSAGVAQNQKITTTKIPTKRKRKERERGRQADMGKEPDP